MQAVIKEMAGLKPLYLMACDCNMMLRARHRATYLGNGPTVLKHSVRYVTKMCDCESKPRKSVSSRILQERIMPGEYDGERFSTSWFS